MTPALVENVLAALIGVASTSFATATGYLVWLLKRRRQKEDDISRGLQVLLRVRLRQMHETYLERGHLSLYELDDANDVYQAYSDLGGNGVGTAMIEEIRSVPRRH